jgi:hypothetical protein
MKQTEEHRRKIGDANRRIVLEKIRLGIFVSPMKGKTHTEAARKKLSISRRRLIIKIPKERLYDLYITKTKTAKECSQMFNCSEGCIIDRLKLYGIKQRTKSESKLGKLNPLFEKPSWNKDIFGPQNSGWKGGLSFQPYTYDWNKRFKKAIRDRDCGCMVCNLNIEDLHILKRRICVHHIDYNKLNSFPQNCVTLCNRCHSITNFNRESWTPFFQSLLKTRYGYKYTENQKILLDINWRN